MCYFGLSWTGICQILALIFPRCHQKPKEQDKTGGPNGIQAEILQKGGPESGKRAGKKKTFPQTSQCSIYIHI